MVSGYAAEVGAVVNGGLIAEDGRVIIAPPPEELSPFGNEPPIPMSCNGAMLTVGSASEKVGLLSIRVLAALGAYPAETLMAPSLTRAIREVCGIEDILPSGRVGRAAVHLATFVNRAAQVEIISLSTTGQSNHFFSAALVKPVELTYTSQTEAVRRAKAVALYDRIVAAGGLETEGG